VTVLHLKGYVEQPFTVDYPPHLAFAYFAKNEDLLRKFLGEDRVEVIDDGVYRVKLNPHGAMGLTLQPTFDVQFIEHPPHRVEMKSLRASLLEVSHGDAGFDAKFTGEAHFAEAGPGTFITCWSQMEVKLGLPGFLSWAPVELLATVGNGIIQPAMAALAWRLVPIMQKDIHRWVAEREKDKSPVTTSPSADGESADQG
jgi:hypothetical protein